MNNQTRTNQGGSVAGFLIVGAVLVALTLGGIYLVQNREGSGNAPAPSAPPASSQAANPSKPPSASPSASPAPTITPSPSSQPDTGTAPSSSLPSTGPTDDALLAAIPAGLLTAAIIGYFRSHKLRRESFYR